MIRLILQKFLVASLLLLALLHYEKSYAACFATQTTNAIQISNCPLESLVKLSSSIKNPEHQEKFRQIVREAFKNQKNISADLEFSSSPLIKDLGITVDIGDSTSDCESGQCTNRTVIYIQEYADIDAKKNFIQEFGFVPDSDRLNSYANYGQDIAFETTLTQSVTEGSIAAVQFVQAGGLQAIANGLTANWKVLMHGRGPDLKADANQLKLQKELNGLLQLAIADIQFQSQMVLEKNQEFIQTFEILDLQNQELNAKIIQDLHRLSTSLSGAETFKIAATRVVSTQAAVVKELDELKDEIARSQAGLLSIREQKKLQNSIQKNLAKGDLKTAFTEIQNIQRLSRLDKNYYRREQYSELVNLYVDNQGLIEHLKTPVSRSVLGHLQSDLESALGEAVRDLVHRVQLNEELSSDNSQAILGLIKAADSYFAVGSRSEGNRALNQARAFLDYQEKHIRTAQYADLALTNEAKEFLGENAARAQSFEQYQAILIANEWSKHPELQGQAKEAARAIARSLATVPTHAASPDIASIAKVETAFNLIQVADRLEKLEKLKQTTGVLHPEKVALIEQGQKGLLGILALVESGHYEDALIDTELMIGLIDAGLGFVPGVGWAKDVYEAVTGKSILTGEELSSLERGSAILGSMTAGIGSKIKAVTKAKSTLASIVGAIGRRGGKIEDLTKAAEHAIEIEEKARKAGITDPEEIKALSKALEKGEKFDPPEGMIFSDGIKKHMTKEDGFSQKNGVSGAHDKEVFEKVIENRGLKVISREPSQANPGVTKVTYKVPARNARGELTGEFRSENFFKSVYDPKQYDVDDILAKGKIAAAKGFENAKNAGKREFPEIVDGLKFRIYRDSDKITNYFLE